MKGINRVVVAGDVGYIHKRVVEDRHVLSFTLHMSKGEYETVTQVNVEEPGMLRECETYLRSGGYVIVEGWLVNRKEGEEVYIDLRAQTLVFKPRGK